MGRPRPIRDLGLAIAQLTVVPVHTAWPEDERPDVAGWYPLVGLVLASAVAPFGGGFGLFEPKTAALLLAAICVTLLAFLTRGLHWDGLADVADAWYIHDAVRRREVLKDSAIGAFGALAMCLFALVQVAALGLLIDEGSAAVLVIAVACGRLAATFSAWFGSPARRDGLGAAVSRTPGVSGFLGMVTALAVLAAMWASGLFTGWPLGAAFVTGAGVAAALVVPHVIARRFGGTNGDTMGASIVTVETMVLVIAAMGALL